MLAQDGEEFFAPFVDDCISLCQDISSLCGSRYTDGIWASGLSVLQRFEETITKREGIQATMEFMRVLRIEPTTSKQDILTLALKMLLNNRLDYIEYNCL